MKESELRFRSFDLTFLALFRIGLGFSYFIFSDQIIYPVCSWMALLCSLALVIGWKPRWSAFFCLLFTLGFFTDPLTSYAGDRVYRLLLLMAIFLPTGERLSLFRASSRSEHPAVALVYTIQIAAIYFFAGISKLLTVEWRAGKGALYALSSSYATPWGGWVAKSEALSQLANHGTLFIELIAPVLILISYFTYGRKSQVTLILALILLFAFHLSVATTFQLFAFQWVSILALLPLIPVRQPENSVPIPCASGRRKWAAGLCLALILALNIESVVTGPRSQSALYRAIGIKQSWSMFSWAMNEKSRLDVFLTLKKGDRIEWDDQGRLYSYFFGEHTRQRRSHLTRNDAESLRSDYAKKICSLWNDQHQSLDRVQEVEWEWVRIPILSDGSAGAAQIERFAAFHCPE
jgi:uncharacterized membrane protein YphA (DoxX/SURF4 family)